MEITNFLEVLNNLATITKLSNFYAISASPSTNQISLQGHFNDTNTSFAKEIGIDLTYDQGTRMLSGNSLDNMIRIVLT